MIAGKTSPKAHADHVKNATQKNDNIDEAVLASLGYKQEFKREFSRLQIFGVGFSIIGVVPSIACVVLCSVVSSR